MNTNRMIAAAVAAALFVPVAHAEALGQPRAARAPAATADDVRALREQLEALTERMARLEQANEQLAAQNTELKAAAGKVEETAEQVATLQEDLDLTVDQLAKTRANAPEWAGRYVLRGDLRYRYEQIWSGQDRVVAGTPAAQFPVVNSLDRDRQRIRFRFGGTLRVNDTVTVGMTLATGADDPRSSNLTLGDGAAPASARRAIGLDQAFFAWQPTANWLVRGGKMVQPWVKPGASLLIDNDINPEGVSVNYTRGLFFGSASYVLLQERGPTQVVAGQGQVDVSDPAMGHLQAGVRYPFTATSSLTAGVTYFDHFAVQGRRPFFAGNANGNTTVNVAFPAGSTTQVAVAAYDYDTLQAFAQYERIVLETMPLTVWGEYANNDAAPRFATYYGGGVTLGRASNPRTWELGVAYQKLGKDAMFGQWVDSDFGNGNTDTAGWVVRGGYAVKTNWTVNATYFVNQLNNDVFSATAPRDRDYTRLQVDTNFRF